MLTKQMTSAEELVKKWIEQQKEDGKTEAQLRKTMFVYGDRVMEIEADEEEKLQISEKNDQDIVIFRTPEPQPGPFCRCCSMEYDNEKEALQCCAYID
ncbi:hypothetical protein [Alkalicoccus halolimnae]|uniref:Uncharacterized protein n=1 Tax=Alkalicoccus halolimnae TaxID=1667239 RepID=A0A5C7FLB6_9BACI|nr:hypothetical protein [Alkalicoccus halolimnae]TXF86899.1 hypothetical protein FTX54_02955 [Alkalicoccus halolimnae]